MVVYDGSHSITFGDGTLTQDGKFAGINTWEDWRLIPSSRPTISDPEYSSNLITIPGRNGTLDLSDYLTGKPVYGDRSGSFQFIAHPEAYQPGNNGITTRNKIISTLHGKRMKMCFSDDPGWYYDGRFTVAGWNPESYYSTVTINYQVGPYKTSIIEQGNDDIIWDTFNFELDYDWYVFHNLAVSGSASYSISGPGKIITPVVTRISGTVTASFKGVSATVNSSTQTATLGTLNDEESVSLSLSGNGTVTISFREQSL